MPVQFDGAPELPSDVFSKMCQERKVKQPNKTILRKLKMYSRVEDVEELDLSQNYIGARQMLAICDLVEKCSNLDTLNASGLCCYHTDLANIWNGNNADDTIPTGNEVWSQLVEVIKTHPNLTSLNVSDNDCGPLVGKLLEEALKSNKNIISLEHNSVLIDKETLNGIDNIVEKNLSRFWETNKKPSPGQDSLDPFQSSFNTDFAFGESANNTAEQSSAQAVTLVQGRRKRTRNKSNVSRRVSRSCAPYNPEEVTSFKAPVHEKTDAEYTMLRALLKQNLLFAHLSETDLKTTVMALFKMEYNTGDTIMTEGEEGDTLYTISEGEVDVIIGGKVVAQKSSGVSFGELALMYNTPRSATIRAASKTTTWGIDRDTYRNIVMSVSIRRREEYQEKLQNIPFLKDLKKYEILQLADALESHEWNTGDYILRYDQPGEYMYIVLSGSVEVIGRDENDRKKHVHSFSAGQHFGELEFLNSHRTVADIVATEPTRTARLNRNHFELCLGPVLEVFKKNAVQSKDYAYYRKQADKLGKV
eukprot:TRINITY_DN10399_c0_g1_i1.p1 TRINITY_DN10399_c0_g1~~TRINITY_DN10399_c0_g1_i1.p1  ORF type:complete len:552 (+),score=85.18 TRINITY_DN10399_c0_g1_i1:62-1657(+)